MHNLLRRPLPENELAAIFAETAGRPALPLLGDAAWTRAAASPATQAWLRPLLARADAEAGAPMPELTDELYASFFKTGVRLTFDRHYFERRRRLGRAAIAVLMGGEEARAPRLASFFRKLEDVLGEESWTVPAHVWKEPSGRDPMHIDLFCAECANNFAELLAVFGAVIPASLATRIRERLRTRIFQNFVERAEPHFWESSTMNWNAVCHQGVLGAALAVETDAALLARMWTRALPGLPRYLDGFGDDGATSEGPGYWSYGFGWFTELNAQLEHRTRGRLSLFEGDEKIARIARFAPLMTLAKGQLVNFSDGSRTGRLSPSLLACLGERLDDPVLRAEGVALYRHVAEDGIELEELRRDFFNFSRLALRAPSAEALAAATEPARPDVFFPDYGAVVARGRDASGRLWEFAAKGGHNDEHHNHNDCGSFLLQLDGAPALLEIGAPEYVHGFFGPERYTFLAARSLGHSVPLVNGVEQGAGREFAATVREAEVGPERAEFVVDLAKAYPPEAGCRRLVRTFVFEKNAGRLTVTDEFDLAAPGDFAALLILPETARIADGALTVPLANCALRLRPGEGTRLAELETCGYSDHLGRAANIKRARLQSAQDGPNRTGRISFSFHAAASD